MKAFILVWLSSFLSGNLAAMEYVAHRGASDLAPENTLAAVRLAWELGADAVEVDVHLSRDNQVVVIHDETTRRTTGETHRVAKTTAAILRTLDAGSFKDAKFAGEKIPLLSEVLETVPKGRKLLVEIKTGTEILLPVAQAIARSKKLDRVVIISFDLKVAAGAKKMMSEIPVYWLANSKKDRQAGTYRPHKRELIEQAKSKGLDGLGVHFGGVTGEFAERVKGEGLKLFVWTVNQENEARRLQSLGIDGLITDRPGWMRNLLEETNP
jgi:glycerophosphoryl diester phosphodiesterase